MKRGPTGSFDISTSGSEAVRAFVPNPLPPDPPPSLTSAQARLHDHALLACGRLDAVTTLLPEPDLFLFAYVRREALLSSQIEGTQSSLSDLLLFELEEVPGVPFDDVVEVSNYINALEHGAVGGGISAHQPAAAGDACPLVGARTRRGEAARRVPPYPELDRGHAARQRQLRAAATPAGGAVHGRPRAVPAR